jgi:hypothetical protein
MPGPGYLAHAVDMETNFQIQVFLQTGEGEGEYVTQIMVYDILCNLAVIRVCE